MDDIRGKVLEAVTKAAQNALDERAHETALSPTVKIVGSTADTVTARVFSARREYRITIEAVRP